MCLMRGRKDPSRVSTNELDEAEVVRRINNVANAKLTIDWAWGLAPYDRDNRPPQVSRLVFLL